MSSIPYCKNCGISGPAQTSKCFPSEVGNDTRHEFIHLQAPATQPGNYHDTNSYIKTIHGNY